MALEILKTLVLLILFLLICLVTFTSLGFGLLKLFKIKLQDNLEKYTLSTILGIAVFTLVSYLSVILHVRFILWVFPVFGVFLSVKYFKSIFLTHKLHFSKSDFIYFFLIIFFGIVSLK